jgi:hypothetical protein
MLSSTLKRAAMVVVLTGCAGSRAGEQEKSRLEREVEALRGELAAEQRKAQDARQRTDGALNALVPPGTGVGVQAANAGGLLVEWSSVHAGKRLTVHVVPEGNGERVHAGLRAEKGNP